MNVDIRPILPEDREAVLHIARELVRARDAYAFDPDITEEELWRYWSPRPRGDGFVATRGEEVLGMFVLKPNHPGPGAHVANGSYAVRADQRGQGLGRAMGEASLRWAVELGYRALQFNAVVSTNEAALRLWTSLGFDVIGTVPEGFQLPDGRRVAHHILYRSLVG